MPAKRPRTTARLRTSAGAELPLLITLDAAADWLGCARSTAHEWAARADGDGRIPGLRVIAPGVRRVVAAELLAALGVPFEFVGAEPIARSN